ncbi:hypothetical protein BDQ12DRAFT_738067 [Crucibulum laeve]|uniref:Uncharacterized protein n=1 Tax=Crucibulum laeve TaxID=68775 RepID=A0A5C3LRK5_9AGAR|nr:hypothetical protein BDQ12DRAFT_738067 [Crucibulum laeve]
MSSKAVPSNLVAFPSVSSSLHSLPHATSMQNVSLHPNMYAQHNVQSEAKLQRALSSNASSPYQNSQPMYYAPPPSSQDSALLMRKPKTKV